MFITSRLPDVYRCRKTKASLESDRMINFAF